MQATIKYNLSFLIGLLCAPITFCQVTNRPPVLNKKCPDFKLHTINYYTSHSTSLKELRGKFVILDFFATGCSTCFESFKHTNQLRSQFRGKVEFILVGSTDRYIKRLYEKFRIRQNLQLPVAYDSSLFRKWQVESVPRLYWIDDKGVVQAVSLSSDLTEKNIESFIHSKAIAFHDQSAAAIEKSSQSFNPDQPLLTNGNGGNDTSFLYRSILASWDIKMPQNVVTVIDNKIKPGQFQVLGIPLYWLYNYAYFGRAYWSPDWDEDSAMYGKVREWPVLELKDTSLFHFDFLTGEHIYNFAMSVPALYGKESHLKDVMQRELKNYFNYDVTVENRMMPYWRLTATDVSRLQLKTKGDKLFFQPEITGLVARNCPLKYIIYSCLWTYNSFGPPIVDETGIDYNIDLTLDVFLNDWNAVKAALWEKGLRLEKAEKPMKVLVIRDGASLMDSPAN